MSDNGTNSAASDGGEFSAKAKKVFTNIDANAAMRGAADAMRKTDQVTGKFMVGVFKFGKIVSAIFAVLAIVAIIGAFIYSCLVRPASFQVPEFDEVLKPQLEENGDTGKAQTRKVSNEMFKRLRNKYGDTVDKLIEISALDAKEDYNKMIEILAGVNEDFRGKYLSGAISFMKSFRDYARENPKKVEVTDENSTYALYHIYTDSFMSAQKEYEDGKSVASDKRALGWMICGYSIASLILFLIIPLLIQIEENTRPKIA